jgi:two-component system NtrC family sensor kinase
MLEKPYWALKKNITLIFAGVLLVGTLMGAILISVLSSRLASPIKEFEELARRISAGERGLTITVDSRDEIGDLAAEFNQMTSALTEREEEIRELNRNLERKVQERTTELEEKNRLLVKTQEELVQAEKLADLGVLAAGVAHEINNPMAIIRGNAELLQMSVESDSDNSEEVETIIAQVGRVERIVANLLTFARQGKNQFGHIAINAMLDDILHQIGHQTPLTGIEVRTSFQKILPDIDGDEGKLRQVFTNLLLNAIQAMGHKGSLSLSTELHEDARVLAITVADTGSGIDRKLMDKVFSPFFTTKASGTGLGLSVSYGIIKEHNGTIDVQSEPGKGTRFRVLLPISQPLHT